MSELSTFIGGASGAKPWVSGAVIKQYAYVISPADLQLYQRKTATGSGTTDPADDTTNYNAASYPRWTSLPARGATAFVTQTGGSDIALYAASIPKTALTTSAGVRTLAASYSGRGMLEFLGLYITNNSASRTFRIEILCDGRTVYDVTHTGTAAARQFLTLFGVSAAGNGGIEGYIAVPRSPALQFFRTLAIYITSSTGLAPAQDALAISTGALS